MEEKLVNKGFTIWFTGLSGSGKSTIANSLKELLLPYYKVKILDGDVVRNGINKDLTFSVNDRQENIRRIAEVAKLFTESGFVVLVALISPLNEFRKLARDIHLNSGLEFLEIYVNSPLNICEQRDVKGLYKLAREGKLKDFTGIDSPYETPKKSDLEVNTHLLNISETVDKILNFLLKKRLLHSLPQRDEYIQNDIIQLFMNETEVDKYTSQCDGLPFIDINKIELQWIQILSEGWATPLKGFMKEAEYLQTLHFNSVTFNDKLHSFSLPIVLGIPESKKNEIETNKLPKKIDIALKYNSRLVAVLINWEIYPHRKDERCSRQFGIDSENHPTIKLIKEQSDWLIGGDLKVLGRIQWDDGLDKYRLSPIEIRKKLKEMGADAVYAFQLRNPIHNGHVLLMKETREILLKKGYKHPVLLLHPLGGWTKDDDVPLPIRIKQHLAVINDGLLDSKTTLLAVFPSPMVYAGPTEVQWHCRCRIVAGANYYIVGRDPAGLPHPIDKDQNLYDPTHGSKIIRLAPSLGGIKIIPFVVAAYNTVSKSMEIYDPDRKDEFLFISGTKMRTMAREGIEPPDGFMSPEGWEIMKGYYQSIKK